MEISSTPSEATPAPATQETPAPKEESVHRMKTEEKPERPRDRATNAVEALKKRLSKKDEDADEADDSDDEDEAPRKPKAPAPKKDEPKSDAKKPEPKDPKPAPKKDEPKEEPKAKESKDDDAEVELKVTRAARERDEARREAAKLRKELEKTKAESEPSSKELAKLKDLLETGKKNPLAILKAVGHTFESLAKGIDKDEFTEPKDEPSMPKEFLDRFEKLEKELEAARNEKQTAAQKQKRDADEGAVKGIIEAHAERFPYTATASWAVKHIVDEAYAKEITDVGPILEALEESLATNALTFIEDSRAFAAALKRKPELRTELLKRLGVEESAPETDEDEDDEAPKKRAPKSLSEVDREPKAPRAKTKADRAVDAIAALKKRAKDLDEDDD